MRVKTTRRQRHALLVSVRMVIVSLTPRMKGAWLRRWVLMGIVNAAVGVSDRDLAVAHHKTNAGTSEVTERAPTFVGSGGNVFPGTIVSRFFVLVMFRTLFRLTERGVLLVERRGRDILFVRVVLPYRGDLRVLRRGRDRFRP